MPTFASPSAPGKSQPYPGKVRAVTRIGHADTEFLENPHAPRADQVAARFGTGKDRLVDQGDTSARPGEHESGDAAPWAGPPHARIPALAGPHRDGAHAGRFTGPVHRASTSATASVGVAHAK